MIREEAVEIVKKLYNDSLFLRKDKEALEALIPELTESKDERIRKGIVETIKQCPDTFLNPKNRDEMITYLEKLKEKSEKQIIPEKENKVMKVIEGAIRVYGKTQGEWIAGYDMDTLVVHLRNAFASLEKLKEASKAIEAVEKIDKYIDEHLANAHDMKDSNPDKKYYRGWDDALGKMSGILQDVYSGEKQEKQKPVNDKAFEEWIDGWYNEYHRDGYITMNEREFKNFCRGIRNMYQQNSAEWSEEQPTEELEEKFKQFLYEEFLQRR